MNVKVLKKVLCAFHHLKVEAESLYVWVKKKIFDDSYVDHL